MLVQFTVGNFLSFKEPVTLSMVASRIKSKDKRLDTNNVFEADTKIRLLKSAAVYGANASGKTNLVKAMRFMRYLVLTSSRNSTASDPIHENEEFRLDSSTQGEPSLFEIIFFMSGRRYRYGFEVRADRVVSEWLYWVPTLRESRLFVRDEGSFNVSNQFYKEPKLLKTVTRTNALLLSVVAQFNGALAMEILQWFREVKVILGRLYMTPLFPDYKDWEDEPYKKEVIDFVKRLDLGIADIKVKAISLGEEDLPADLPEELKKIFELAKDHKQTRINTVHQVRGSEGGIEGTVDFRMDHQESDGTQKIFSLAALIVRVLREGMILIADELDARLHPLITLAIIDMFHRPESNPHNAQLLFTTHDTNLLDANRFRRDQIWFIEKDEVEASHLFSLVEYKVRNDASFEKNYLLGKYGGIPYIHELQVFERNPDVP